MAPAETNPALAAAIRAGHVNISGDSASSQIMELSETSRDGLDASMKRHSHASTLHTAGSIRHREGSRSEKSGSTSEEEFMVEWNHVVPLQATTQDALNFLHL